MASSSNSRTQRLLEFIKLAKEKQIPEPDKWAERILIKEEAYEQRQADRAAEEKKRREDREAEEKRRQESEKQRQKAEKQREYERRKQRKIIEEIQGHNYRIEVFQRNIKDYDERMELCNIMVNSHKARIEFIESQDLNDFASDTEDEVNNKQNTKSHIMKDKCQIKQEEIKEDTNKTDLPDNNTESNDQMNETIQTKNEPFHKTRFDNIESMIYDSSKSTSPDQTTTSSSPPTSTCPPLSETTYPLISSTYQSLTANTDYMPQDLNKAISVSISTTTMTSIDNPSHNKDKSQQPVTELIKETHQLNPRTENLSNNQDKSYQSDPVTEIKEVCLVSSSSTPDRKKTVQLNFIADTSIAQCEPTKEDSSIMNIESLIELKQFATGDKVKLLLPDLSNKIYTWQGPFDITRKISDLFYEFKINNATKVLPVHMLELYQETEDITADLENGSSPTTVPEEEETSTTIHEIDISLPASQVDSQKVITPDDIPIQTLTDIVIFRDQAELFTSVPDMFPVLNIDSYLTNNMKFQSKSESSNMNHEVNFRSNMNIDFANSNNSECSNMNTQSNSKASDIDNTHPHSPLPKWTDLLLERTNGLIQHYCIDSLNFNMSSHCSIGHYYTEHFTNITIHHQGSSYRKLCFGIGQFIFLPNSNAIQSVIICVLNTRWKQQLRKLKDLFFKFRKHTHYHDGNSEET